MTNFWVKITIILSVLVIKFSLPVQNEIIYNFMTFVARKNGRKKQKNKFPPSLLFWCRCYFRSVIRDPGSWIRDG
jgi:hypothetical protein